jgi:hypothetical protein
LRTTWERRNQSVGNRLRFGGSNGDFRPAWRAPRHLSLRPKLFHDFLLHFEELAHRLLIIRVSVQRCFVGPVD